MNRRSFVKASGLAAALGVTGLAGCSGILGGGGSAATKWQYDPSELSSTQARFFGSMQYGAMYDMRDELPGSMSEDFDVDSSDSPVSPGDIELIAGVGGGQVQIDTESGAFFGSLVVTGSFDAAAMEEEIAAEDNVTAAGEYEGYSLYEGANLEDLPGSTMPSESTSASASVALSDSAVVFGITYSQGGEVDVSGTETVEAMVDAEAGNVALLGDNNQHAATLQSELSGATMAVGGDVDASLVETYQQQSSGGMNTTGQYIGGLRAGGFNANVSPSTTSYKFALVYNNGSNAESTGIVTLVNMGSENITQQPGINSVSANRNGGTITVTIEGDTQTLLSQGQNQVPMAVPGAAVASPVDF